MSQKQTQSPDVRPGSDPYVRCVGLYVRRVKCCGHAARCAWSLTQLVATPGLVWRLMATIGPPRVTRLLVAEPQEVPVLMLAHWWVDPASQISHWPASGWAQFLTQLAVGPEVSQSWCWLTGECWGLILGGWLSGPTCLVQVLPATGGTGARAHAYLVGRVWSRGLWLYPGGDLKLVSGQK